MGRSREDLSTFPKAAKLRAGQELFMVQVGRGAREIRVRDQSGAFRVIYVATLRSAVYVLHAFQKKTQTTGRDEIELAKRRYKEAAAMQSNA